MKHLLHTALFFIAFLGAMLMLEIYFRSARISDVTQTEYCEGIGKERRSNINYFLVNEGIGIGNINAYRFIGESCQPLKPLNTIRIALLGDSFIESYQVFERHYFGKIAETLLKKKFPGKDIEILNFGCAGFEITDMYAYQKNTIEKFNPDYIFYLISDDDLEPENSDPLRPRVILENDSLMVSYDFSKAEANKFNRANFFLMHSAVLNMLNDCRKKIKTISPASILLDKIYSWFKSSGTNPDGQGKAKVKFTLNPVTARIIETLDPEKVVIINRGDTFLPIKFTELCQKRGLKFFDLYPTLKKARESGTDPQYWSVTKKHGHWNYYGHKLVGKEIYDIVSGILENRKINNP
jgi:hypothetical protein